MVKAIIVGLNEWDKFTLPMLNSAKKNDPELKLYLVDNGSAQPYPQVSGVNLIRNKQKDSYAAGLNLGIKSAGEADCGRSAVILIARTWSATWICLVT